MSDADVTYRDATARLLEAVPELREVYEEELAWSRGEDPGNYIVYETLFKPYLLGLLEQAEAEEACERALAFLERLAESQDVDVRNLLRIGLLETMIHDYRWPLAEPLLGRKTVELAQRIRSEWDQD